MALGLCGVSQVIQSIDERSNEAMACKVHYDAALGTILRKHPWPFAQKRLLLALVGENLVTNWTYVYGYPADCAKLGRRVVPGLRITAIEQTVPYEVANYNDSKVILTDLQNAEMIYTAKVQSTGMYDDQFCEAFANLLASRITATFGKPEQQNPLLQAYYALADEAFANSMDEQGAEAEPDSFLMRARA